METLRVEVIERKLTDGSSVFDIQFSKDGYLIFVLNCISENDAYTRFQDFYNGSYGSDVIAPGNCFEVNV